MAGEREREIEEETRIQMMQNLFGEQSEDEEEEDEEEEGVDEPDAAESESERGAPPPVSGYPSEGEGDIEIEGEGEVDIEGHGEVEPESDADMHGVDSDQGESEVERAQTSEERGVHDQRLESEEKDAESDEHEYEQRVVTSKRRNVIPSESEKSEEDHHYDIDDDDEVEGHPHEVNGEEGFVEHHYEINDRQGVEEHHSEMSDEEEVGQEKKGRSPNEEPDLAVFRDVFGESDEDEVAYSKAPYEPEQEQPGLAVEEDELGNYEKTLAPEDMVQDEYAHYGSEDENAEQKANEKPMGPPLDMEIPLQRPPGLPDKMNMIKVSNIMGIEPKPFDSKTYVEEDVFITDESGAKKRIRLEDNIVRWRSVRNRDGSNSYESNARFVKWSDGSLQLLIGNEVLDLSVQESQHDHTHLFLRHGKGILQSQGRLLRKMRFMPSSLSSKSHRLLTALVDSRHKKVYKVKNCITDIDPEREKEEKERAEGQSIRANEMLQRKRERVTRKYTPGIDRGRQLSPGFLEEALDEDNEHEDYAWRSSRRRLEEDMELEIQGEERIVNAKRSQAWKDPRKQSLPSVHSGRHHEYLESEKEESEYESDGEEMERSPEPTRPESDNEDEYQDQYDEEIVAANADSEEEEPEMYRETGVFKRKDFESDEEDAPPRKTLSHRRKAVVFDSDDE